MTGYSTFFGVKEDKPLKYIDQIPAWKKFGPLTKVNLYYSYTYSCIQGIKTTYGYDAHNAQLLGGEAGLTSTHLVLAPYENINRVEIKTAGQNRWVYVCVWGGGQGDKRVWLGLGVRASGLGASGGRGARSQGRGLPCARCMRACGAGGAASWPAVRAAFALICPAVAARFVVEPAADPFSPPPPFPPCQLH